MVGENHAQDTGSTLDGHTTPGSPTRRALVAGAAWATPVIALGSLAPAVAATGCTSASLIAVEPASYPIEFRLLVGHPGSGTTETLPAGTTIQISLTTLAPTDRNVITAGAVAKSSASPTPTDTYVNAQSSQWNLAIGANLTDGMVTAFWLDPGTTRFVISVFLTLPQGCPGGGQRCWSTPDAQGHFSDSCNFSS